MVVAAHPDDETIGLGGSLARLSSPVIVHATDGSPPDPADARAAGFSTRDEYARARRDELLCALALAGISADRTRELGIPDQGAALRMGEIAARLRELFDEHRPALVFTHAYEGGHPDHDATAFAVHAACRMAADPPSIVEFTSYHDRGGAMESGRFLPGGTEAVEVPLDAAARRLKRAMFDCFATQRRVLGNFSIDVERFRKAPEYDFTLPPHAGTLYYERFEWGMTGERFRALAREVLCGAVQESRA
jgi:LmbE family N-acetylglucosaminyl deacetylase